MARLSSHTVAIIGAVAQPSPTWSAPMAVQIPGPTPFV